MIKQLWSLCKLNEANTSVDTCNSALIGLSKFDRSDFKIAFLPELVN